MKLYDCDMWAWMCQPRCNSSISLHVSSDFQEHQCKRGQSELIGWPLQRGRGQRINKKARYPRHVLIDAEQPAFTLDTLLLC